MYESGDGRDTSPCCRYTQSGDGRQLPTLVHARNGRNGLFSPIVQINC